MNYFDVVDINERFEIVNNSCIYQVGVGGYRSSMPVVHKTMKSNGKWVTYLTRVDLDEASRENKYLASLNKYIKENL